MNTPTELRLERETKELRKFTRMRQREDFITRYCHLLTYRTYDSHDDTYTGRRTCDISAVQDLSLVCDTVQCEQCETRSPKCSSHCCRGELSFARHVHPKWCHVRTMTTGVRGGPGLPRARLERTWSGSEARTECSPEGRYHKTECSESATCISGGPYSDEVELIAYYIDAAANDTE